MHISNHFLRCFSYLPLIAAVYITNPALAEVTTQQGTRTNSLSENEITEVPRIQLAILLDTSSSMNGLIDQTRNQLWQIVNEFSTAKKNGATPILEIALFEYGNSGLSKKTGYIRKLNGFTRELDKVSEGLFSLTTNGGDEYCGYVIKSALTKLQWSRSDTDVKTIFIAGNESFAQGPVDFREVAELAMKHGITINTIHAGGHQVGIRDDWQAGALLAQGAYMSIDANQEVVHIDAPQDKKIAQLNAQLNATYIPYGKDGANNAQRQMEQDVQSGKISPGLLAKRAKSKSSTFYSNSGWDLVDALTEGKVDEEKIAGMKDAELPQSMQGLSADKKLGYVRDKMEERKNIKQEIDKLSEQRNDYVAKAKREQAAAAPSMGDALTEAIIKQAGQKEFEFEK